MFTNKANSLLQKYTVDYSCISVEEHERITVGELILALRLNIVPDRDEGGLEVGIDTVLIQSIKELLQYFLSWSDYEELIKELKEEGYDI